jgi:23S rRNA (uracil1939-C5)-methyltransferase
VPLDDCPVADSGIRKALQEGKLLPPPGRERFAVFSSKKTFLCEGVIEQGRVFVLDRELAMDVRVFFQSNTAMLELLIGDLKAAASKADRALPLADIYCGVGTFASFIGGEFSEIDLVEENKTSLMLARENMPQGKKVNYFAFTDTDWTKTQKKEKAWGFMVLDAPRKGLSFTMREFLVESGPELAAYVSCDPATLARDSRFLLEGGYALKELTLYDFYPQTAHIESLAIFSREKH